MKSIILLKNINKFYGKKQVLKNISFSIKQGDRIAFLGGNGSGKTTALEILARIREASSGSIEYDPNLIIGMQFQESDYPIGITVKALIDFNINRYGSKISKKKFDEMLKIFRLENLYKKQLYEMSGGQKQRVNIMLALIHNPNFIILDELSTGLDIKVRKELRLYINKYLTNNPKTSLIIVTHSMEEAQDIANRVIILDWGVITYDLSMKKILKKYKSLDKFADKVFEEMYRNNKRGEKIESGF